MTTIDTPTFPADLLNRLGQRVHPEALEETRGMTYIGIDATLDTLQRECGSDWEWVSVTEPFSDAQQALVPATDSGKPQYGFVSHGVLTIHGVSRSGQGADYNFDPDTAAKASDSYALRKAAQKFNIARYLAKKSEREILKHHKKYLQKGELKEVGAMAKILFTQEQPGVPYNGETLSQFLSLTTEELSDPKAIEAALTKKGFVF